MYEIVKSITDESRATEFVEGLNETIKETQINLATKDDLKETKFDMIKWFIAICATQTGIILAFLYFMLKK